MNVISSSSKKGADGCCHHADLRPLAAVMMPGRRASEVDVNSRGMNEAAATTTMTVATAVVMPATMGRLAGSGDPHLTIDRTSAVIIAHDLGDIVTAAAAPAMVMGARGGRSQHGKGRNGGDAGDQEFRFHLRGCL